jgi:hypothetical protein
MKPDKKGKNHKESKGYKDRFMGNSPYLEAKLESIHLVLG